MNTLEAKTITSPYGKSETCSLFTIDDVNNPFLMENITAAGQDYTLSFWIRSETECSISIAESTFNTTASWAKYVVKFTAEDTDLSWSFNSNGIYYVYHPQLETGNQATDWRPNPDDVDEDIANATNVLREAITEQSTSIINTADALISTALESRVSITEYGTFKDEIQSELKQTADDLSIQFNQTNSRVDSLDTDMQSKFTEVYKHISFTKDGINISAGENSMTLQIDNDIIRFTKNGLEFGQWNGVDFKTGNIKIDLNQRAQFGNFAFVPRSDGSLSFLKVEHNTGFYAAYAGGVLTIFGAYPKLVEDDSKFNLVITDEDIKTEVDNTTLILGGQN